MKMPLNSDTTASTAASFQVSLATADMQLLTLILLHRLLGLVVASWLSHN